MSGLNRAQSVVVNTGQPAMALEPEHNIGAHFRGALQGSDKHEAA